MELFRHEYIYYYDNDPKKIQHKFIMVLEKNHGKYLISYLVVNGHYFICAAEETLYSEKDDFYYLPNFAVHEADYQGIINILNDFIKRIIDKFPELLNIFRKNSFPSVKMYAFKTLIELYQNLIGSRKAVFIIEGKIPDTSGFVGYVTFHKGKSYITSFKAKKPEILAGRIEKKKVYCLDVQYEKNKVLIHDMTSNYLISICMKDITIDSRMRCVLKRDRFKNHLTTSYNKPVYIDSTSKAVHNIIMSWTGGNHGTVETV